MVVVLMIATVLLVVSLAVAVFLERRPAPTPAKPLLPVHPPARPLVPARSTVPVSRERAVRACDDLQALLRCGVLAPDAYRQAVADLAAAEARRRPLLVPADGPGWNTPG